MKATLGRIVRYNCSPIELAMNGGQPQAPAMITQVHSQKMVNLRVMWNSENATTMRNRVFLASSERPTGEAAGGPSWEWPKDFVQQQTEKEVKE